MLVCHLFPQTWNALVPQTNQTIDRLNRSAAAIIFLTITAAVAAGLLVAKTFQPERYVHQGRILYNPDRSTAPYLDPPPLVDLKTMIVDTPFERSIHQACQVESDFKTFARNLVIDSNGSSLLTVSYAGNRPEQSEQIVAVAMERFIESANQFRRRLINDHADAVRCDIVDAEKRHQDADAKLRQALEPFGITGIESFDPESFDSEIDRLEQQLSIYRSSLEAIKTNLQPAKSERQTDDPSQTRGDEKIRQSLEAMIQGERGDSVLGRQIEAKRNEYQRSKSSFERNLISKAAFERVRDELQLLQNQQASRLRELQWQLSQITDREKGDNVDRDSGDSAASSPSPLSQNPATESNRTVDQWTALIAQTRQRLGGLIDARRIAAEPIAAEPINALASTTDQLGRLRDHHVDLQIAGVSNRSDFVIVHNAAVSVDDKNDDWLKWLTVSAVGIGGLLLGLIFVGRSAANRNQSPAAMSMFGYPILARRPTAAWAGEHPDRAAIEMQRTMRRINRAFGRRDGVLTIAGGTASDQNDGLVRSLADFYRCLGIEVCVADAADLVTGSEASKVAEMWVQHAKQGSAVMLVRSPLVAKSSDADAAAAISDAVVAVVADRDSDSPEIRDRIARLSDLGGRIIGVIIDPSVGAASVSTDKTDRKTFDRLMFWTKPKAD